MSNTTEQEMVREVLSEVVEPCYCSPLRENIADGIHGMRFFYFPRKSLVIEYFDTTDDILGVEFFDGGRTYGSAPGECYVTFLEKRSLSEILPFVKDFLRGKITEPGGIYLNANPY